MPVGKNKEEYNAYMKEYMRNRWINRREKAIEQLGGKCVLCGSDRDLQFDHIDPMNKSVNIAKMSSASERRFQEELSKCQLLCSNCHEDKSIVDSGKKKAKGTHGTISSYRYCRCNECRSAWSAHCKEYRLRRKAEQFYMGV